MVRVRSSIVPGFFTMANMFCGFFSAVQAANGNFVVAGWLIVAAAVLDSLDGKLARMTQSSSQFGEQYDSLADVVSFGLAPSMLVYFVHFHEWGSIGLLASFIPLVFGSVRLARFNANMKEGPKTYFNGIPIPAAAGLIATFVIFNFEHWQYLRWSKVLFTLVLISSFMMITNVRYEKMPNFTLQGDRRNRLKVLVISVAVVTVIISPQNGFFIWAILYLISGPLWALPRLFNSQYERSATELEGNEQ